MSVNIYRYLGEDVPTFCIFDVFKAHQVSDFKELMTKNNIRMRYVPAGCTFELQPIDLSSNDEFKNHIKYELSNWYAPVVLFGLT